jgi:hypothetical protein
LGETNITPVQTDGIQWRVGNPNLNTSSSYSLALRYKYTLPRVDGVFSIRAFNCHNAVTPYLYWQDDKLITSYENSKGLKSLTFTLSPQFDAIPDWLMLEGTLQYRVEQTKGIGYTHNNHNWSGDITATAYHWGFSLLAQYQKAPKTLFGETFSWGETMSIVMLGYDWNDCSFGVGMICPFTKFDTGSQSLNRYNSNKMNMRLDMDSMPFVKVTYNLQWGRQKSGVQKMVNVDSQVDTSSAGGK